MVFSDARPTASVHLWAVMLSVYGFLGCITSSLPRGKWLAPAVIASRIYLLIISPRLSSLFSPTHIHGGLPYNIYAKQLFHLAKGYPLWVPEHTKFGEVLIGDVGYLHDGGFYRLFNATLPANHDIHTEFGVPDDYEPLKINRYGLNETKNWIKSGEHMSKTVKNMTISANASAAIVSTGAGFTYTCTDEQGALLLLKRPGDRSLVHKSRSFMSYMRRNHASWHRFATDTCDVDLQKDEIIFVNGCVKSAEWAVAAFIERGREGELYFSGEFGPMASAGFSLSMKNSTSARVEHRMGPPQSEHRSTLPGVSEIEETPRDGDVRGKAVDVSKFDQCVFLEYYKMKKRIWFYRVIKAAAGPHELPSQPDDSDPGSPELMVEEDDIEEVPFRSKYDPVDYVLDYILENSNADLAIAGTQDIISLCKGQDVPDDIAAMLKEIAPRIDIDEDGVGIICAEDLIDDPDVEMESTIGQHAADKQVGSADDAFPEHSAPRLDDKNTVPTQQFENDPFADPPQNRSQRFDDFPEESVAGPSTQYVPRDDMSQDDLSKDGDDASDKDVIVPAAIDPPVLVLSDHAGAVSSLAYSPNGRYIASGSEDASIVIWDTSTGRILQKCQHHVETIWSLKFSPDSTRLVSGSGDHFVIVWDVESGDARAILDGHTGVVQSVAYSPDGNKIASGSVDFTVRLWDAETGTTLSVMKGHTAVVMFVVFSPNGKWLASVGADYTARIWNAETGVLHTVLQGHTDVVWWIAFSPDSRRVVTGSDDGTSRIWNAETGEELVTLHEHHGPVWFVGFSPDGKRVLSASNDSTIKVCDSFSADRLLTLEGHGTMVNAAAFSPDGSCICSSSGDNLVRVWRASDGVCLATLNGHADKVTALEFSPDGSCLASSSDDGTVRLWNLRDAWDE
ncbi:Vegetative incompatibility protein HET-E-1 [Grifola frondosa]|uniref:Vegetative incompatibility protein HET-E-1 n=1 Tax=Grifola frondosa TaxID=5627 RepID=A0A1C7LRJ5_GRIFR|nr:Vegetative incompatibility protein HET-E-1 [Grifola frondosa]